MTTSRRAGTVVVLVGLVVFAAACAAGPNPLQDAPRAAGGEPAGFFLGLWHGLIAPITFVVSLFSSTVGIYEAHNTGGWYDAGFLSGMITVFGGGACRGARRRDRH